MSSLIIIIGNPAARKSSSEKIDRAAAILVQRGYITEILMTEKRGDGVLLARESLGKKPLVIIAAGGDGTINEVANGMVRGDTPLALLPLGTTNVLAKEIGIPETIDGALEAAISGTPHTVSLGRVSLETNAASIPRYFFLMAGIGFDGMAVHDVNPSIKKISGKAAYILSGVKNLIRYYPNEIFLSIDGKEYSGYSAIIGKASRYGGHFMVTPDAKLSEPSLYTCIFTKRGRSDLLRYVSGVIRGSHLKSQDIIYLESHEIEVLGTAHIQIDGDYLGLTPARISVEKDALRIIH